MNCYSIYILIKKLELSINLEKHGCFLLEDTLAYTVLYGLRLSPIHNIFRVK